MMRITPCVVRVACVLALLLSIAGSATAETRFRVHGAGYVTEGDGYHARVSGGRFEYYSRGSRRPDLVYTLVGVEAGGRRIEVTPSPTTTAARNVVCCDYGKALSESYTAGASGVEQCWVINQAPDAAGDIVIRGAVTSPHTPRRSAWGVDFTDRLGRRVFTYGSVTAIDADGKTHTCQPHISGGRLSITLPRGFVESARFPILVDPVVGPEVPMCPTFGAAPAEQENSDITASNNGCFVVWQDRRGGDMDIFGCRVSATGEVLDKMAIGICTAAGDQTDPAVAWNGSYYLVVWMDRSTPSAHIYCARVLANGEVLDRQAICLSGTNGRQGYPDVASDGGGFLVVWQHALTGLWDIQGCKVNGDGSISRVYSMTNAAGDEEQPVLAWNGTSFLLAWRDNRNLGSTGTDIYACRIARNGVRLPGEGLISCTNTTSTGAPGDQRLPQICAYGSNAMVVWEDTRGGTPRVYGSRIDGTPKALDPWGISIPDPTGDQEFPSVSYNGSKLLVVWRSTSDLFLRGARLTTSGQLLDPSARSIVQSRANNTGIASVGTGSKFMVAWCNLSPGSSDVLLTPVLDGGSVGTPASTVASLGLDDQREYAIADCGTEYAVVWSQPLSGGSCIMGARVSRTGELLSNTPVNITLNYPGSESQPAIAWNGTHYLLTWTADSGAGLDIKGCRLRTDLTSADPFPLSICSATEDQSSPCVAACGASWIVVWEDWRNTMSPNYYNDLYGAIVSGTGAITPIGTAISLGANNQKRPRAASSGSNYLVVWEDYRAGYPKVTGTIVTTAGAVQSPAGLAFPATSYVQTAPAVCFGSGSYFVVWSDWYSITGCRVSASGDIQDASGIPISGGTVKACPGVCWDGARFRVVWEDYRSSFSGNSDIYYTTVSPAGVVSPDPEMTLVSDLQPQLRPSIVASQTSGLLVYARYVNFASCTQAAGLTDQQVQEVATVGQAKHLPPGTLVSLRGKIVTGAFPGYFYVQEPDRSSGIKVVSTVPVSSGDIVDAVGTVSVCDGERQISAGILSAMGVAGSLPKPLGIRGDAVGGGRLNGYTPGITGGVGTNNVGLLITTWGKVTTVASDYFIIESKPGLTIKVRSGSLLKPAAGKMVSVTGICTCDVASGVIGRAILPRDQNDIRLLN